MNEITGKDITTKLFVDNQSSIKLIKNPEFHKKTKHIDVRYHFVREAYNDKVFDLEYVPSGDQLADVFTKPLGAAVFHEAQINLGLGGNVGNT